MTALSPDAVLKRFELVSGYDRGQVSRYALMILDCIDTFCARLPDNAEYDDTGERRLIHACAVYAYYRVSQCCEDERVTGFKAGDVQYTLSAERSSAERMWQTEKCEIADLVDFDGDMAFKGVIA